MIELLDLTKRYGDKTVVDRVSFTVQPGVVTGYLGPNGAGKSTTMRMLLGLTRPSDGTALVNGRNHADSVAPMSEVGALLDAKAVDGGRSARNHLRALAATAGFGKARVDDALETVGLTDVATDDSASCCNRHRTKPTVASSEVASRTGRSTTFWWTSWRSKPHHDEARKRSRHPRRLDRPAPPPPDDRVRPAGSAPMAAADDRSIGRSTRHRRRAGLARMGRADHGVAHRRQDPLAQRHLPPCVVPRFDARRAGSVDLGGRSGVAPFPTTGASHRHHRRRPAARRVRPEGARRPKPPRRRPPRDRAGLLLPQRTPPGHRGQLGILPLVAALYTTRRRIWWALAIGVWTLVVLVAISRVWLGVHWTSDVIASIALATLGVALAERYVLPPTLARPKGRGRVTRRQRE